jgi:lysozyme
MSCPVNDNLEPSPSCVELVKRSEGCPLKAYWDRTGWACGYGCHAPDIVQGTVWTQDQADSAFEAEMAQVAREIKALVNVPLTQGQFDALMDFTYNLGSARLAGHTLLADLNAGKYIEAGQQLLLWDHEGSVVNLGLKARREQEFVLWLS